MTRHEIPTHLDAPDRFLTGLTVKQAMQLVAAAAAAYGVLSGSGGLSFELRLGLAAAALLLGLLVALVRPGGRPLEEWAILLAFHLITPRRLVWRPCPAPVETADPHWSALSPRVGWVAAYEEELRHVR